MKLSEWARKTGVHYQTAWKWIKTGKFPVRYRRLSTGTILIDESDSIWKGDKNGKMDKRRK